MSCQFVFYGILYRRLSKQDRKPFPNRNYKLQLPLKFLNINPISQLILFISCCDCSLQTHFKSDLLIKGTKNYNERIYLLKETLSCHEYVSLKIS
jgi:hypothetical protein